MFLSFFLNYKIKRMYLWSLTTNIAAKLSDDTSRPAYAVNLSKHNFLSAFWFTYQWLFLRSFSSISTLTFKERSPTDERRWITRFPISEKYYTKTAITRKNLTKMTETLEIIDQFFDVIHGVVWILITDVNDKCFLKDTWRKILTTMNFFLKIQTRCNTKAGRLLQRSWHNMFSKLSSDSFA